jgi:hypothetical protein
MIDRCDVKQNRNHEGATSDVDQRKLSLRKDRL